MPVTRSLLPTKAVVSFFYYNNTSIKLKIIIIRNYLVYELKIKHWFI